MNLEKSVLKTRFIVNPHSAGGATGRRIPEVRRRAEACFADFDLRVTARAGQASELAAEAAGDGFELVVAVGGDGTANEVINGLLVDGSPRSPGCAFACLPAGTGSDFVRTVGMPRDLGEAMRVLARGDRRPTDAYRADFRGPDGTPRVRYGINIVDAGMGGEVAMRVNSGSKQLGGTLNYLLGTLSALAAYRSPSAVVRWVDPGGNEQSWEGKLMSFIAANGLYFGGGMHVGRGGSIQDGLLELSILPPLSPYTIVRNFHRLYSGELGRVEGVVRAQARSVEVTPSGDAPLRVDLDGEQPGVAPLRVQILERVLLVCARW